ncbi:ABC transporter substrate-binding protein [Lachnoclostridium sp. Marseille-P6806]|uniref:ABC transporter substrate-binding protein n=1 Tax=Lachnoclostridium sp. Marseille-P6806 TaxID=2364793 RepID=UPI00102FB7B8|nr:ABC transporter substrate-binding protein [Lachnoclostridium sp. Marseille-P6806]
MKKRVVAAVLAGVMAAGLAGCGAAAGTAAETAASHEDAAVSEEQGTEEAESETGADAAQEPVSISFYTTETGKDDMFQDLIRDFQEKNPGITVEYIAAGDDQLQKWMSLYASNEGPTVSLMDPINIYENRERMKDLTDKELIANIQEDALSTFTFDGRIYGAPYTAAGIGILYNQAVCDEAVGGTFDPASIKTRSDLEDLFNKIEATGRAGTMFTGVNWSLGAHYVGITYGAANGDVEARVQKVADLKAGQLSLADDEVINDYFDTFDMMAEHNYNKEDPLVGNINMDAQAFADGAAGTWFMGDWAWTYLGPIVEEGAEFGLLPVPLNDDPDNEVNTLLPTSFAKGYCVDASQNSKAQQAAGVKFIQYITSDEYAEEQLAKIAGQALPYKNFNGEIESPLGRSTASYISAGRNYDFYGTPDLLPSDFWYENGAYMCEYISGACDRQTLFSDMEAYWKNIQ